MDSPFPTTTTTTTTTTSVITKDHYAKLNTLYEYFMVVKRHFRGATEQDRECVY